MLPMRGYRGGGPARYMRRGRGRYPPQCSSRPPTPDISVYERGSSSTSNTSQPEIHNPWLDYEKQCKQLQVGGGSGQTEGASAQRSNNDVAKYQPNALPSIHPQPIRQQTKYQPNALPEELTQRTVYQPNVPLKPLMHQPDMPRYNNRDTMQPYYSQTNSYHHPYSQHGQTFPNHKRSFPHHNRGHRGSRGNRGRSQPTQSPSQSDSSSETFVCEKCDRAFKCQEKYDVHCSTHVKCKVDGCKYEAAEKLVQIHYKQQHLSGFATKIYSVSSETDIRQWIEERKRNYPSAGNVAHKLKSWAAAADRGEVIQTRTFGSFGRHPRGRGLRGRGRGVRGSDRGRGRGRGLRGTACRGRGRGFRPCRRGGEGRGVRRGLGRSSDHHLTPSPGSYTDGDVRDAPHAAQEVLSSIAGGAAGGNNALSLLMSYGSSDDSDAGSGSESGDVKDAPMTSPTPRNDNDAVSTPSATKHRDDTINVSPKQKFTRKQRNRFNRQHNKDSSSCDDRDINESCNRDSDAGQHNDYRSRLQHTTDTRYWNPTLLEKLLAPDIRHERNVVLQCVKYVVKRQFFGVGAAASVGGESAASTSVVDDGNAVMSSSMDAESCDGESDAVTAMLVLRDQRSVDPSIQLSSW